MASSVSSLIYPALLAVCCLLCLYVGKVCGVNSRTKHRSDQSVLATLDSEFSFGRYFSSESEYDTRLLWTRHKRAIRNVEYQAIPVSEDTTGTLFSISSTISDANLRRFSINSTSAGMKLVSVDKFGNVYLMRDQRLDYENEQMRPLIVVVEAVRMTNPSDIVIITATLPIRDINDEHPVFRNAPAPYLATVAATAAAGVEVYELYASDDDEGSELDYQLVSADPEEYKDRFEVITRLVEVKGYGPLYKGYLLTKGSGRYPDDKEIKVDVSARDVKGGPSQLTVMTVRVLVGVRPPQFYQDPYYGFMYENSPVNQMVTLEDGRELKIATKKFQKGNIRYELYDDASQRSNVFTIDNRGNIFNRQVLDYESKDRSQQPLQYRLVLWVLEDLDTKTLSNNATLIITILDMNDHKPEFETSQYLKTVREDLPVGSSVTEVTALDKDSGVNAELIYSVNSDFFYVETVEKDVFTYSGVIKVKKNLDFDRNPGHFYEITVFATDKGAPPKSSSVNVRVTVTNVNDEAPEFTSEKLEIDLDENAPIGTVVAIIQAVDLDGDAVSYYFSPKSREHEAFRIDPDAGLITLARSVLGGADFYPLNITAYDDGSCCSGNKRLSQDGYIIVQVVDINTHKPTFERCADYSNAKVKEHSRIGSVVLQVEAIDQDRGENGIVRYGIVAPSDNTFRIGREDGVITVGRDIDREVPSDKYIQVTVNVTDGADPPLDGWCTFRVAVEDINDNRPQFDRPEYSADITSDSQQNQKVILVVRAYDSDIGKNGEIEYSLVDDGGIFGVYPATGFLYLKKALGSLSSYKVIVMAKDKGTPPLNSTASVTINVAIGTSNPPTWDKDYDSITYEVSETAVAVRIATMKCFSNIEDERVEFQIIGKDGTSSQSTGTFFITYDRNTLHLYVDGKLDYETVSSYSVGLRCLNFGPVTLKKEVYPTIELIDKNDELPYFRGTKGEGRYPGSVQENLPPGQDVITITGYDNDIDPRFSRLTFSLERPNNDFEIVQGPNNTAIVRTKSTFDRESRSYYDLTVIAKDSVNSDRHGHMPPNTPNSARVTVEVFIKDQNDNAPYFTKPLYQVEVGENQYIDTAFAHINAEDPDETDKGRLNYLIVAGNAPLYKFGMKSATGGLFVAKTLDYESYDRFFELTLNVSDGKHTASTRVQVTVQDANDNAPEFVDTPYRIEDVVVEEDKSILQKPKLLMTVLATDQDTDRHNNISYSLQGYGTEPPNQYFRINNVTGQLYVIRPMDRDAPNGRYNYQFTVVAKDEPSQPWQFGYATVEVLPADINDNRPTFDATKLKGSVDEHSPPGTSVMFVLATDPDRGNNGSVVYDIIKNSVTINSKEDYFVIDRQSGLIKTNVDPRDLDRETIPSFTLEVRASDEGNPPLNTTATITISLSDINDQKPVFDPQVYRTEMSENQKSGEVFRVGATDADMGNNTKLTYRLADRDSRFFQIITIDNMGSILVYGEVDYEQAKQQFFNLTVIVEDPNPQHTATAYVAINVRDFNDNAPAVTPKVTIKEIYENEAAGFRVAIFNATDKDSGDNAKFEFSIDRHSDPRRHFSIHPETGIVSLRKPLDRETQDRHTVIIRAIDKGDPPMTGTGTLTVIVKDINDNFPRFLKNYQPQVKEGDDNFPAVLQEIFADDPDAPPFGAPFGFASPVCEEGSPDACPCKERPTCGSFDLIFEPYGDGGNGSAIISTKEMFDRESQKYYYIPIVMWDMRGKNSPKAMTGTNTLTVTIADINDNIPKPGHQNIFVYNYKGMFGPLEIGRVYVEDKDDWDLEDKTFTFAEPAWLKDYFSVNESNGMVTMNFGVPGNTPERPRYEFKVDVYDSHWNVRVRSTVTVTVRTLSEEAVANSGAIRISGTSAEEFIIQKRGEQSKKDRFHSVLAGILGLRRENVDIISVMDQGPFTDVRYAAHGSPYYQASQTDSAVVRNQRKIEEEVDIEIVMVPIDACAEEQFEGGCFNYMNITGRPAMVNANGTSFVGVEVHIVATAGCRALAFPDPNFCTGDYCYHGGTCISDDWGVLSCQCPESFNGPRCQQIRHSFDGDSYAFFPTLEQCEISQTTIEFITQKDDGLLLYNGPIGEINMMVQPEDFISLELLGGYPRLMINHGTGTRVLTLDGRDKTGNVIMQQLSDGSWHRIDIIRSGKDVELVVDNCRSVPTEQGIQVDTSPCRVKKRTPGENTFLNVNTLLQLGGRYATPSYPTGITEQRFDGCVRNLVHNGKLYDLYYKPTADFNSGFNGCPREDQLCGGEEGRSRDLSLCGVNGKCSARWDLDEAVCVCDPGWRGKMCDTETTVRNLKSNSHFRWTLNHEFFSDNMKAEELEIQMMFRTRDTDGVLFTASSTDNTQTITLEIKNSHIQVLYNLGDGEQQLELSGPPASDGQWHTVNAKRVLQQMTLTLDGGEGRNYNFSRGNPKGKVNLILQRLIFAGASVSYSQEIRVLTGDLTDTCIQDIRLNNGWFPMDFRENSDPDAVAELKENPNVEEGCVRNDCLLDPCPSGRQCYPLWEDFECRCPSGYHEVEGICISDCIPNPCFKNVTCRITLGQVTCVCPPDKSGDFCREPTRALTSSVTTPGIVAIVVSLFVVVLLLLLVFMLVKFRRHGDDKDKYILEVDPEDDIRENVINYDEEGAGEEDQDAYDISRLQKTDMDPLGATYVPRRDRPLRNAPGDKPDVGDFISDRLGEADGDPGAPPHDSVMEFGFEGAGSDAGSLSSLNTSNGSDAADYDYLNEWGPKFTRLAQMYGAGEEGEED